LANQYRKLTHEKEMVIKQEYNNRIKEVDAEITALIDKIAKKHNCNAVFANTSMVTGGKDITAEVIEELK
jgi:Skp family chaperone for outer membrane proteins